MLARNLQLFTESQAHNLQHLTTNQRPSAPESSAQLKQIDLRKNHVTSLAESSQNYNEIVTGPFLSAQRHTMKARTNENSRERMSTCTYGEGNTTAGMRGGGGHIRGSRGGRRRRARRARRCGRAEAPARRPPSRRRPRSTHAAPRGPPRTRPRGSRTST
uniref:Uncharacterized protein n=1 Tax=Arundo donax TaxID=35708 RepID=A0A0A9EWY3_ARUDO